MAGLAIQQQAGWLGA